MVPPGYGGGPILAIEEFAAEEAVGAFLGVDVESDIGPDVDAISDAEIDARGDGGDDAGVGPEIGFWHIRTATRPGRARKRECFGNSGQAFDRFSWFSPFMTVCRLGLGDRTHWTDQTDGGCRDRWDKVGQSERPFIAS